MNSQSTEPPELEAWQQQKARLHQTITARQARLEELKAERKKTPRHLTLKELPPAEQFPRLRAGRKHFVDTIKLIAYRAETALVGTVREALARSDDGRALVRELMRTTADLHPNLDQKTLTVCLHPLPSRLQDEAVRHLAAELTATETVFPGTDLRLVFQTKRPILIPRLRRCEPTKAMHPPLHCHMGGKNLCRPARPVWRAPGA